MYGLPVQKYLQKSAISLKKDDETLIKRQYFDFKSKIGSPDLVVLFTSTVSHRMVHCAVKEAQRKNVEVVRSHTSSSSALRSILQARAERCAL